MTRFVWGVGRRAAACMVLALCAAPAALSGPGAAISVTGEGRALGLGPAARSSAIEDAQAAIILDRLEKIAPSRDFSIFAPLLQAAPAYFQSFKLVRETKTEDSTQVEIDAQLLDRKLKQEIARIALEQNFVTPRIVVLAEEHLAPDTKPDLTQPGILEKKLHDDLKRVQFEILDSTTVREKIPTELWTKCIEGDPEFSAILARDMLADIVVLASGTSHIEDARPTAKISRIRAKVSLRVVRAEDGYVLDAPHAEAVVNSVNPTEGGAQAIEDACGKLITDAKTAVALGALNGAPDGALLITIEHVSGSEQIKAIIASLEHCVGAVKHEILYQDKNLVRVRIEYTGPVGTLIDRLPALAFGRDRLSLKTVVDRDITLVVEES